MGALRRLFWLLPWIACLAWFARHNVWRDHFDHAGSRYVISNLGRVVFALYFFVICRALGQCFLQNLPPVTHLRKSLLCFSTGVSTIGIGAWIFGNIGWLDPNFFRLVLSVLLLVVLPTIHQQTKEDLRSLRQNVSSGPALLLFLYSLTVLIVLLVWKGVYPETQLHDMVAHLLPMLQKLIDSHKTLPSPDILNSYPSYFVLKGDSLQLLFGAITDLQSIQALGYIFLVSTAFCLVDLAREKLGNFVAVAVGLFYITLPFILDAGFQKIHVIYGSLIILLFYGLSCIWDWCSTKQSLNRQTHALLFLPAIFATLMLPFAASAVIPLLAIWTFAFFLAGYYQDFKLSLATLVFVVLLVGSILMMNYWETGLVDMYPALLVLKHGRPTAYREWLNPLTVVLTNLWEEGRLYNNLNWPSDILGNPKFYLNFFHYLSVNEYPYLSVDHLSEKSDQLWVVMGTGFLLFFATLKSARLISLKRPIGNLAIQAVLGFFFISLFYFVFWMAPYGSSSIRFGFFTYFFKVLLLAGCLSLFLTTVKKFSSIITGLLMLCSLVHFVSPGNLIDYRHRSLDYLRGRISFDQVYWPFLADWGTRVAKITHGDAGIVTLTFCGGCYSVPRAHFQHPLYANYQKQISDTLYGGPSLEEKTYRDANVGYFFIDVKDRYLFSAYADIFQPTEMMARLKPVWHLGNVWLLAWKDNPRPSLGWSPQFWTDFNAGRLPNDPNHNFQLQLYSEAREDLNSLGL